MRSAQILKGRFHVSAILDMTAMGLSALNFKHLTHSMIVIHLHVRSMAYALMNMVNLFVNAVMVTRELIVHKVTIYYQFNFIVPGQEKYFTNILFA